MDYVSSSLRNRIELKLDERLFIGWNSPLDSNRPLIGAWDFFSWVIV